METGPAIDLSAPVTYFIEGVAAPQGSKRHVGNGRMVEMSKKLPQWRATVEWATRAHMQKVGGLKPFESARVTLGFNIVRPRAHFNAKGEIFQRFADVKPTTRPDLDKLTRAVFDGLVNGGILEDDARVHTMIVTKRYVTPYLPAYSKPGCWVVIEP
jgi:Holliday junction resolvase RusA-like endonuclease